MTYTNRDFVKDVELSSGEKGIEARGDIAEGKVIGIYDGQIVCIPLSNGRIDGANDLHRAVVQVAIQERILFGLVTPPGDNLHGIDFINHSCRPNIGHRDRVVLFALRDIRGGEPLVMDYRDWDFIPEGISCWCVEPRCLI